MLPLALPSVHTVTLSAAEDATDVVVLRIVIREGFTKDLADSLIAHLEGAAKGLQEDPPLKSATRAGFSH